MKDDDRRRGRVCSLLRRGAALGTSQGVRDLLTELSSQMCTVGRDDVGVAFERACRVTGMIGDAPVLLANRVTVSAILDDSCRAAGVSEPHIDAASIELMVIGGITDVADDD